MKIKMLASGLSLSALGLVGLLVSESYTDKAIIPTVNDRPTVGFGSTFNEDGTPVKMGDKTTPPKAVLKAYDHIAKEEQLFRSSIPDVSISQIEYDVYVDFTYQYGSTAWFKSSMRKELLKGEHVAACKALLLYKRSGGYDCSIPGNKICAGVWTRQLARYDKCMSAQ